MSREIAQCLAAAVVGASMLIGGPSHAQDVPNLVGTWKASAQGVHIGTNPFRPSERAGTVFSTNALELTFTISEQKDNRVAGQLSDGRRTETLIGAISPNNQGGILLDDDGQYLFTIRDRNTLDACYSHLNPSSKVVGCYTIKRAP